jgi:hypothetical protein
MSTSSNRFPALQDDDDDENLLLGNNPTESTQPEGWDNGISSSDNYSILMADERLGERVLITSKSCPK